MQPGPQGRQHLLGVHRLGEIVPGPRLDALLAVALHGLGGHGDDRQVLQRRHLVRGAKPPDSVWTSPPVRERGTVGVRVGEVREVRELTSDIANSG